jgi:hypothetical protein
LTQVSQPPAVSNPNPPDSAAQRAIASVGAVAATFTAMCCVGASAAVSLSTAMGATFLTRDATLRPLLAASLAVTVAGSALTFWQRRRPWPLALSAVAALWIYAFVYVVNSHSGQVGDHMGDHAGTHSAGFSGGRLAAIWLGLAVLVGSQAWDLLDARRRRRAGQAA